MQKSFNVLMAENGCNRKAKNNIGKLYVQQVHTRCCRCRTKVFHKSYIKMVKLKRVSCDLISLDLKNTALNLKRRYHIKGSFRLIELFIVRRLNEEFIRTDM